MKKIASLCLTSLLLASANAATYNAQGKIINSKDAKNPGIVKFEKNKVAATKSSVIKPTSLAKDYAPTQVQARKATYDQNTKTYTLNGDNNVISESAYLSQIDSYERYDAARLNGVSTQYTNNNMPVIPYKSGNTCKRVNYNLSNEYTYFDIDYSSATKNATPVAENETVPYAIGYYGNSINGYNMYTAPSGATTSSRCQGTVPYNANYYAYTCGAGINIYTIAGDDPVTFNGNSCVDSRQKNYKEGIKLYYANQFIHHIAERVSTHHYKDRYGNKFAQHPSNPYSSNMHIGNIISSPYKNQSIYNKEAASLDDFIYTHRVIEFAPYTNDGGRTGAGLALNAITVAGATSKSIFRAKETPANKAISGHMTLESNLGYPLLKNGNNNSKYLKPEIYNVSNGLFSNDTKIKHDNNEYEYEAFSDAWGAATVSAAMTADVLEKYPFYKWHPEVVKALWISSNYKRTDSEADRANIYDRNTANYTGSLTTFEDLLINNKSRYWYGNNTDYLSNNKITFTESVEPGQKYGFAIAWLVRGDYALNEYNLSSNFQLTISYKLPSGSTKTYSSKDGGIQRPATYRSLKPIAIPAGVNSVTVTIERIRDTGDRLILGYNRHKFANY